VSRFRSEPEVFADRGIVPEVTLTGAVSLRGDPHPVSGEDRFWPFPGRRYRRPPASPRCVFDSFLVAAKVACLQGLRVVLPAGNGVYSVEFRIVHRRIRIAFSLFGQEKYRKTKDFDSTFEEFPDLRFRNEESRFLYRK
jgi:hypothetical protein